ncbi:MAG: SLC13/DASS family transporter [Bacteroidales bacterium]|nr:SLC13/DASS family transporter [Bacteroidales bacterium]
MKTARIIKFVIAAIVAVVCWSISPTIIGLPDLSLIERRMIAITAFSIILWITEAFPLWVTSVSVIMLMLLLVSDSSFLFLNEGYTTEALGHTIPYEKILASIGDPSVILIMGAFFIAIGAKQCGLDARFVRIILRPFGYRAEMVLLGFMTITAIISMFVSNIATTAMMLAIAMPIIRSLNQDRNGSAAVAFGIAIAANIGGMGTPIGSPPNIIAFRYLSEMVDPINSLSFGDWTFYMFPIVALLILISWLLLIWILPFHKSRINIDLSERNYNKTQSYIFIATIIVTLTLLVCGDQLGLNSFVVGILPIGIFCLTGIVTKKELGEIQWHIIWLFAGSVALGVGLKESQLMQHVVEAMPFTSWPPIMIVIGPGILCFLLSQFMNNTTATAIILPIIASSIQGVQASIAPYGGATAIIICLAFAASMAMALPISTPSNALAYGVGNIRQRRMILLGFVIGIIGLAVTYSLFIYLSSIII